MAVGMAREAQEVATGRSGLETEVAAIMRALRERGLREAEALSRRLENGLPARAERVPGLRRITSTVPGAGGPARGRRRTEGRLT